MYELLINDGFMGGYEDRMNLLMKDFLSVEYDE